MLKKVISGGQTGADFAGLVAATKAEIPTGGWVPKGFRTDAGPDYRLSGFGLIETSSPEYVDRTSRNIEESDGTVIFGNPESPGCRLTRRLAGVYNRRSFFVHWASDQPDPDHTALVAWIRENNIEILNVAGNRERKNPGIGAMVERVLARTFAELRSR